MLTDHYSLYVLKITGGSAWESNPPSRLLTRYTGFEVREGHQCPIHFRRLNRWWGRKTN